MGGVLVRSLDPMSAPVSPRSSAEKLARGARRGGLRAHLAAAMVVLTGALYGGCGDEAEAPSTPAVAIPTTTGVG